jgi:DNA-binding beta-propeller fold protein YncE
MITNEITGTIEVDAQPSCITVNPNGSRLFIADYAGSITAYALTPGPTINRYFDVEAVAVAGARELVSAGV